MPSIHASSTTPGRRERTERKGDGMARTLIRGAQIISMAAGRPAFEAGDILIADDLVEAVGVDLGHVDAEIVDTPGRIIIPGLVNAHLHTWQTGLRSVGADWTLLEYLTKLRFSGAAHFTADDVRVGTLVGAWNQINVGTTTLGDWSHNCATLGFAEAAVDALAETGIRSLFMYGMPMWPSDRPHPAPDFDRLATGAASTNPLVDVGLAVNGPQYSLREVAVADFELAARHGCVISMHQSGGPAADDTAWPAVHEAGLVDPRTNIVHGVGLPDDHIDRLVQSGATFTCTPENELSQGHGQPITRQLLDAGTAPSLGTDVECVSPGAVLDSARIALAHARGIDHERHRATHGAPAGTAAITSRQALAWATVEGARALGLGDRVGSIEPGKQADLVVVDATALNLWPPHDPIATAVQASVANIESVMIAGRWRKRDGELVGADVDRLRQDLLASGQRLVAELDLAPRPAGEGPGPSA